MEKKLENIFGDINRICDTTIIDNVQRIKEYIKCSSDFIQNNDDIFLFSRIVLKSKLIYNMLLEVDDIFKRTDANSLYDVSDITNFTNQLDKESKLYDLDSDSKNAKVNACVIEQDLLKKFSSATKINSSLYNYDQSENKSDVLLNISAKKRPKTNKTISVKKENVLSSTNFIIQNKKNISNAFGKNKKKNKASTGDTLNTMGEHSPNVEEKKMGDTKVTDPIKEFSEKSVNVCIKYDQSHSNNMKDVLIKKENERESFEDFSMKTLPEIKSLPNEFTCLISVFNNPLSLYIVPKYYFDDQLALQTELESFYGDKKNFHSQYTLIKYKYFAIQTVEDKIWCRTIIKQILENKKWEMFCIDFGLIVTVEISSVFPLDAQFSKYPLMAYECYLESVFLPDSGKWPLEMINFGKNCISLTFNATIYSERDGKAGVELSNEIMSLNSTLIEGNFNLLSSDGNPILKLKEDDDKYMTADMKIIVGGEDYQDEIQLCRAYLGPPYTSCFKGKRCKKIHELPNPDGWTREQVEVPKLQPVNLPPVGAYVEIKPTVILSYSTFYCEFKFMDSYYYDYQNIGADKLNEEINNSEVVKSFEVLKYPPDFGEFVLAKHPQRDCWCRGVVKLTTIDNSVEIFFVDIGDDGMVLLENLREVPNCFTYYPPQVVLCSLSGVKLVHEKKFEDAKNYLHKLLFGNSIQGIVVYTSSANEMMGLDLVRSDGISIAKCMENEHMVAISKTESCGKETTNYMPG